MRIQRRELDGGVFWCRVDADGRVVAAAAVTAAHPDRLAGLELVVDDGEAALGRRLGDDELSRLNGARARLLAPVMPSKIVAIGLNYRRHAEEMGKPLPVEPLMFLKPASAVLAPGDTILLPSMSELVHHEGELAVVIGRRARHVPAERAGEVVLGYTIMNDVTARDIQRRETLYTRAKGFDTFAPLGPTVVTGLDPDALSIETRVNGEVRQSSGCDDLIFPIPELVAFVSRVMTLEPGDVISTGTPSGVGPLVDGDVVSVAVSGRDGAGIGVLYNPVRAESVRAES